MSRTGPQAKTVETRIVVLGRPGVGKSGKFIVKKKITFINTSYSTNQII